MCLKVVIPRSAALYARFCVDETSYQSFSFIRGDANNMPLDGLSSIDEH